MNTILLVRRITLVLSVSLLVLTYWLNAWVSDDAFITFRTIESYLHGFGLSYNPHERVQAFTHPLWLMLIIPFRLVTGEYYLASLGLSFVCFTLLVYLLWRGRVVCDGRNDVQHLRFIALLVVLLGSKTFMDYSSSGLENVLSGLILVFFASNVIGSESSRGTDVSKGFFQLSGLCCLAALNRLDTVLLFAPLLGLHGIRLAKQRDLRELRSAFLAFIPLGLWFMWSYFYYGYALPNTAAAKLSTEVSFDQKFSFGLHYLQNSLEWDPLTLAIIALAGVVAFWRRSPHQLLLMGGVVAYLGYLVLIGGDFMSGRFLYAPLIIAVMVVILPTKSTTLLIGLALLSSSSLFFHPRSPLTPQDRYPQKIYDRGIADERMFYFSQLGFFNSGWKRYVEHGRYRSGVDFRSSREKLSIDDAVGLFGMGAGVEKIVIDRFALVSPFVARLPLAEGGYRPGHLARQLPARFVDSEIAGKGLFRRRRLNELYREVKLRSKDRLFSRERLLWLFLGVREVHR